MPGRSQGLPAFSSLSFHSITPYHIHRECERWRRCSRALTLKLYENPLNTYAYKLSIITSNDEAFSEDQAWVISRRTSSIRQVCLHKGCTIPPLIFLSLVEGFIPRDPDVVGEVGRFANLQDLVTFLFCPHHHLDLSWNRPPFNPDRTTFLILTSTAFGSFRTSSTRIILFSVLSCFRRWLRYATYGLTVW